MSDSPSASASASAGGTDAGAGIGPRPDNGCWRGRTAVITGAASGFGLEASRIAASRGMQVVMVDVQADSLQAAADDVQALATAAGGGVLAQRVDVSDATRMDDLGRTVLERHGAPHFVFNNAGVASGGLVWEHSAADWNWVLGVNLLGVAHGLRVFVPPMLQAAAADPTWRGHVVNTASMAGLLAAPNMGLYNASKHAVVALSETLYQDLALVTEQVSAHVLCPYFVPTGIHRSDRNRPAAEAGGERAQTASQRIAQAMSDKAVTAGKVSAAQVAGFVFDAMDRGDFYVFSHPTRLAGVQTRLDDIVSLRNPSDPFAARPEIGAQLRQSLRAP
ncbi:MAG: SDR family oxidoreductase [Rubrivivax sp.]